MFIFEKFKYISNFNANNVTGMKYMFNECTSLEELDLSNFNTDNANDIRYMFCECSSLKKLNLSNFQANNVSYLGNMFYRCVALKELICEDENLKYQYEYLFDNFY